MHRGKKPELRAAPRGRRTYRDTAGGGGTGEEKGARSRDNARRISAVHEPREHAAFIGVPKYADTQHPTDTCGEYFREGRLTAVSQRYPG